MIDHEFGSRSARAWLLCAIMIARRHLIRGGTSVRPCRRNTSPSPVTADKGNPDQRYAKQDGLAAACMSAIEGYGCHHAGLRFVRCLSMIPSLDFPSI
jgi:hypothetical protein